MRCLARPVATSLALLLAVVSALWTGGAAAQADAVVTASLRPDTVEVGRPFVVELRAMVTHGGVPTEPRLRVPAGLSASGPNIGSRTMMQFGGGQSLTQQGITATWQLVAGKDGRYRIPSPTVLIDGQRVTASGRLRVRVVAAGSLPQTPRRHGFPDPFGQPFGGLLGQTAPFGGLLGGHSPFHVDDDFFQQQPAEPPELSAEARRLALPSEPQRYVFVRMVADKTRAVVGEQVSLSYYVYFRTDLQLTVQHEPPLADFLRLPLDKAAGADEAIVTTVGPYSYHVKLLDKVAAFPLHAGVLDTGVLTTRFRGRRFAGRELERVSNPLSIVVREPPLEGRPLGYRFGDVGRFRLDAEIAPRRTRVGETVAVKVRVTGVGAPPSALRLPERTGIEWLTPEKREEIGERDGKIAGWRSFGYAVRFAEAGQADLGAVELPYYDPDKHGYRVARAEIGTVLVEPSDDSAAAAPSATGNSGDDPFASLAKPRAALRPFSPRGGRPFAPATVWALVVSPPAAVGLLSLLVGWGRRFRRRRRARRTNPATMARQALAAARKAGDPKDAAAAAERAVHLAIEAATGIKSRAVLLTDLGERLVAAGLDQLSSDDVVALLEACAAARFEPLARDDGQGALWRRAREAVRGLLAAPLQSSSPEAA